MYSFFVSSYTVSVQNIKGYRRDERYLMSSKQKRAISLIGITGAVYFIFRYLLPLVVPFLAAWLLARIVWPFVRMLNRHCHIPIAWGGVIGVGLFCTTVLWGLWKIGEKLLEQAIYLTDNIPVYIENFCFLMDGLCGKLEQFFQLSKGYMMEQMEIAALELQNQLAQKALPYIMNRSMPWIGQCIDWFTAGSITILAAILILQERDRIKEWKQNSPFRREIQLFSKRIGIIGGAFVKTEGSIMLVTMAVCMIGLTWIGNPYGVLVGFFIGLIDVLPVFGSGTVFIPWILWEILQGNWIAAIELGVIYLICYIIREIMEAKMLGHYIGMSGLETMIAIYIGWKLFGIAGLFLGPIGWILIKEIDKTWNLS